MRHSILLPGIKSEMPFSIFQSPPTSPSPSLSPSACVCKCLCGDRLFDAMLKPKVYSTRWTFQTTVVYTPGSDLRITLSMACRKEFGLFRGAPLELSTASPRWSHQRQWHWLFLSSGGVLVEFWKLVFIEFGPVCADRRICVIPLMLFQCPRNWKKDQIKNISISNFQISYHFTACAVLMYLFSWKLRTDMLPHNKTHKANMI